MAAGNSTPRLTLAMDLDRVEELSADLERIAEAHDSPMPLMRELVGHFKTRVPHYHWVGIYLRHGHALELGPYAGAPAPHVRIPLDQGLCGAAARANQVVIAADVAADERYLVCTPQTRSEIVAPIADGARVLGVIDIDSDQPNAFNEHDQALLERAASLLAGALRRAPAPPRWPQPEAIPV